MVQGRRREKGEKKKKNSRGELGLKKKKTLSTKKNREKNTRPVFGFKSLGFDVGSIKHRDRNFGVLLLLQRERTVVISRGAGD